VVVDACLDEGHRWSSHKGRMMMGWREVNVCAPALRVSTENGGNPSEAPYKSHRKRYFPTKDSIDPSCLRRKTSQVKPRSDVDNSPKRGRDVFVKSLVEVGAAVEPTNVVRRWVEEMNSEED
jgi:hypothetical protein